MVKINGSGQAKVMSNDELSLLFGAGLLTARDRCLFAVCLYTGCRISEALALRVNQISLPSFMVTFTITKGDNGTRQVPIHPQLLPYLIDHIKTLRIKHDDDYLFTGLRGVTLHLGRSSADRILYAACLRTGVDGVSTHSFRRTCLTRMSNAGVPLRQIQSISGHKDLNELARYLEVSPEQKQSAIAQLNFTN
jgi:integrase/recombinase XerD